MCRSVGVLAFGCLLSLTGWSVRAGGDNGLSTWVHWRGPSGQGYVEDARVPLTWGEKENVVWKAPLPGRGNSTPVIWGDKIFLTAASKNGDERYVLCLNKSDGQLLWKVLASKGVVPGQTHGWNGYASASCTTDGQHVYAFFGTPGLFCYDFAGKLVWKHHFGVFTSEQGWGTAASPFLFGDLVIQNCDNDGAAGLPAGIKTSAAAPMALVALDKATGKVRWTTPRNQGRGFSTPRLLTVKGRQEMILNGPEGVWSYDPATGKELWHCQRKNAKESNKFGEPIPVSTDDTLYVSSGRPGPFQAIRLGGSGDVTKTHVLWEVQRKGRDVSSQLLWGDHLYACDSKANLTCFDRKTGRALKTVNLAKDAKSLGSPVLVRGKLLFVLDTGETVVVEPNPALKVVGRNVLGDQQTLDFGASPAVADGRLLLRSQSHLYCIGEKK